MHSTPASARRPWPLSPITPRRLASAGLVLLTLLAGSAHAQNIHKCRIDGRVVFQSAPCGSAPQPLATAQATTEAAAPAKKKTLADLLRERDGADRTRQPVREFQGDGADVLRSRMGAV